MGFLPFTFRASPIVFGSLWASIQDYPPTHWLPRPLPLLSTCLLHDKIPFCLLLLYTSTSLPSSMACISGPNHLLLLLGKIPSQQGIYPKRSYGRKPNIDRLFPPPPNHALWISLTVGPPPLYWLGTGWWCPGPFVLAPLSFVFVSHAVPTIADQLCFVCCVSLSYFFTRFLLCLSFPLTWLFFPSRVSCCWHFLLLLVSFHRGFAY